MGKRFTDERQTEELGKIFSTWKSEKLYWKGIGQLSNEYQQFITNNADYDITVLYFLKKDVDKHKWLISIINFPLGQH